MITVLSLSPIFSECFPGMTLWVGMLWFDGEGDGDDDKFDLSSVVALMARSERENGLRFVAFVTVMTRRCSASDNGVGVVNMVWQIGCRELERFALGYCIPSMV